MTVALRLLMYINTNLEDDQTIPNSSTLPAFSSVLSINTLIKHIESNGSRHSPCINFRLEPCLRTVYAARHHQTTVVCTNAIKQSTFTRQSSKKLTFSNFFSFSSFFSVIFRTIELDVPERIELRDVDLRSTVLHQNEPFDLLIKPTYIYFDSEERGRLGHRTEASTRL